MWSGKCFHRDGTLLNFGSALLEFPDAPLTIAGSFATGESLLERNASALLLRYSAAQPQNAMAFVGSFGFASTGASSLDQLMDEARLTADGTWLGVTLVHSQPSEAGEEGIEKKIAIWFALRPTRR